MFRVLGEFAEGWGAIHDAVLWLNNLKRRTLGIETTATLNFPNTAAQTSEPLTVTVRGAVVGDFVEVSPLSGSIPADSDFKGYVSDTDEVTVRFHNFSSGAINPAEDDFHIRVKKRG